MFAKSLRLDSRCEAMVAIDGIGLRHNKLILQTDHRSGNATAVNPG